MPPLDVNEHLASLAELHNVHFDDEDLAAFSAQIQAGATPADMEDFVGRYVRDVYEDDEPDDDEIDVDDVIADDETVLDEQRADTEHLIGRLELATQTLGRRLTRDEATRIAVALDKTEWTGDIDGVLAEADVKPFEAMSRAEENAWLAGRVEALAPDVEPSPPPMTETGEVDYDAMSRHDQAEYMARRVEELQAGGE